MSTTKLEQNLNIKESSAGYPYDGNIPCIKISDDEFQDLEASFAKDLGVINRKQSFVCY